MNFAKGGEGEPSLLSFDDARTLFHEFGHALHGMLSDVTYPLISGTHVAGDFVEFPSQLYENWLEQPEMLRRFALPLQDRRADAGGAARQAPQRAPVQPGLRDGRIYGLRARRPQAASRPVARRTSTSSRSSGGSSPGSACRTRSPCATARRISSTSSRTAIRPAITAISGRKFSTPTASRRSRRAATSSIPATAKRLHDFVYAAGGSRDYEAAYRGFPRPPALAAGALPQARARSVERSAPALTARLRTSRLTARPSIYFARRRGPGGTTDAGRSENGLGHIAAKD